MVEGNNRTKRLANMIMIVLILLMVCITVDYATNITITNINETEQVNVTETIIINDTHYVLKNTTGMAKLQNNGKTLVEKQKLPTITIVSKPSCGCRNGYYWHKRTFINYCPYCRKYGVLTNLHKYPARHEQEISCSKCGSDWCGVCGKEK